MRSSAFGCAGGTSGSGAPSGVARLSPRPAPEADRGFILAVTCGAVEKGPPTAACCLPPPPPDVDRAGAFYVLRFLGGVGGDGAASAEGGDEGGVEEAHGGEGDGESEGEEALEAEIFFFAL